MPRSRRLITDEFPYHVMNHLVDELKFYDLELDMCVEFFIEVVNKYNIDVIAYNFMQTHYHLILHTNECNLNNAMHDLNLMISKRYNKLSKRKGHVWRQRYRCKIITSDEQLLFCMRYVDRNPLVAGLVEDPIDWKWGSLVEYARNGEAGFLTPPSVFKSLGQSNEERYVVYKNLVMTPIPADSVPKEWKHR